MHGWMDGWTTGHTDRPAGGQAGKQARRLEGAKRRIGPRALCQRSTTKWGGGRSTTIPLGSLAPALQTHGGLRVSTRTSLGISRASARAARGWVGARRQYPPKCPAQVAQWALDEDPPHDLERHRSTPTGGGMNLDKDHPQHVQRQRFTPG